LHLDKEVAPKQDWMAPLAIVDRTNNATWSELVRQFSSTFGESQGMSAKAISTPSYDFLVMAASPTRIELDIPLSQSGFWTSWRDVTVFINHSSLKKAVSCSMTI